MPLAIRLLLIGVAVVTLGWWMIPKLAEEISVAWRRLHWYDRVYARYGA